MSRKMQRSNRRIVATNYFVINHFVIRVFTEYARLSMAHEYAQEHPLGCFYPLAKIEAAAKRLQLAAQPTTGVVH
jgi:hypothetical protein